MIKSKLVITFKKLTKEDLRALRKFVRSPYFNQREDVILLLDYLDQRLNHSTRLQPTEEEAFSRLYPEEQYDSAKLKSVMHFLLSVIKRYLTIQAIEGDELTWQMELCRTLRKRGLDELFEKEMRKLEKQQQQQPYRHVGYHYQNYQLQLERYEYDHRKRRSGRMNLQELAEELTIFYLADILRHSCTVLTARSMSQEDYQLELLDEVLRYVERSPVRKAPAVAIYHQAYLMLSQPEEEGRLNEFTALIEAHWQRFPPEEARDIYLLAINYCIQRLNRGHRQYIRRAFDWYRRGLERGVLLENKQLSKFTYNNALMLGIALEEWEWAAHFLEHYKQYLPAPERDNEYRYNLAVFYFRKRDYDQATRLLQQVSFADVLYNLNARSMLLRMYYELDEWDALESLLDSFRAFLRRQDDLGYHKENYHNLIRLVRQMLRIAPVDKSGRQALRQKIATTTALAEKNWLLAQLS